MSSAHPESGPAAEVDWTDGIPVPPLDYVPADEFEQALHRALDELLPLFEDAGL
ncbi:hypothetical protein OG948_54540 (plasmid) [Embleya sp. NBC_00888]|uniref:hypothetical protein n=1 Tax=Embleya sp. NBC_00888 TaxID=2975960 RepID=UPI002F90C7F7|nr:hypothetical protein OG948_54540 [Embleya sp. NBC_00888]